MLDLQSIRSNYLFYGLMDEQLECVLELATERDLQSGEALCREGEKGGDLFIVLEGRFLVTIGTGESLAEVGSSSVVGEMGLIEPRPRSATVEALEPSRVAVISQSALRQLLIENGDLGFLILCNLARLLSERLQHTDRKVASLAGNTPLVS